MWLHPNENVANKHFNELVNRSWTDKETDTNSVSLIMLLNNGRHKERGLRYMKEAWLKRRIDRILIYAIGFKSETSLQNVLELGIKPIYHIRETVHAVFENANQDKKFTLLLVHGMRLEGQWSIRLLMSLLDAKKIPPEFILVFIRAGASIPFYGPVSDVVNDNAIACTTCRKDNIPLLYCACCKLIAYCGKDCQKADWKYHRKQFIRTDDTWIKYGKHSIRWVADGLEINTNTN